MHATHCRRATVIAFVLNAANETVSILGVFYGGQDYPASVECGEC
ncbi:hypothetical protein [Pseudomonas sp. HN11]|nr:hypothetical protein [Pseudomonas sp. HN11]